MTARREPPLTRPSGAPPRRLPPRGRRFPFGLLPLLATLSALAWALSTNPLAAPFAKRTGAELALALERAVRRRATTEWIEAALAEAVADEDVDRAGMLLALAADLDRPVDGAEAEALLTASEGWLAEAATCGACMVDIATCPTLAKIAACALPFEMSPLGDLNALRLAGADWARGDAVDELDAGLALVGLAATGAVIATGGTSASVKAGAGLLRVARRMGAVTPGVARALRLPLRREALPAVLRADAPLSAVTDPAALARASAVAGDLGRIRARTSTAETLRLARLVEGPEDAARLARVADAMGPRTTRTLAVLGKSRVFRATLRLSRAAAATLALLWLAVAQLGMILATRAGAMVAKTLARRS